MGKLNLKVAAVLMLSGAAGISGCADDSSSSSSGGGSGGFGGGSGGNVGTGATGGGTGATGGGTGATGGGTGATGGGTGATGGGTGGTMVADNSACGNVGAPGDASGCMTGLNCTEVLPGNKTCTCPSTSMPPACTMGGTECMAFPGTNCLAFGTAGTFCLQSCSLPGDMPVECPSPLTCGMALGMNVCLDGALPPACTVGGSECSAYAGSNCFDTGFGAYCIKSCTP